MNTIKKKKRYCHPLALCLQFAPEAPILEESEEDDGGDVGGQNPDPGGWN